MSSAPIRTAVVDGALTRELRRAVLRPHLGPDDPLPGDDHPEAVHLAAFDADGAVTATCFVYVEPCPWRGSDAPAWQLRQMASDPRVRGLGHGAAVLRAVDEHVLAQGGRLLWCYAREVASGFYARCGWHGHGEVFTDAQHTIPHLRMWREPAAVPASS